MRETHAKPDRARPPLAASRDSAANQSWENEGGATQQGASTERPAVVEPAQTADPTPPELAAIDAIRDEAQKVVRADERSAAAPRHR